MSPGAPLEAGQFHPNPSRPRFVVPPAAVDAHCHVFGPAATFPFAPERKYTPSDAPKEGLFALRDHLGFARNVIVQATCHGRDNRALVDALRAAEGRARGVAVAGSEASAEELRMLHDAGVRGVRFNFLKRLVDFTSREELDAVARKVADLGWHVVVYFEMQDLEELAPFFRALPTAVVIDHMGRPDVEKGTSDPAFRRLLELLSEEERFFVKVSCPERLSRRGPPYADVVPFARALVERFPDRVLWGTDWPHPNMTTHVPDDGELVDMIPQIAPSADLQARLLVANPTHLYWET